jgi:hypothetical protein
MAAHSECILSLVQPCPALSSLVQPRSASFGLVRPRSASFGLVQPCSALLSGRVKLAFANRSLYSLRHLPRHVNLLLHLLLLSCSGVPRRLAARWPPTFSSWLPFALVNVNETMAASAC